MLAVGQSNKQTNKQKNNCCLALTNTGPQTTTPKAGKVWEWSSDTVNYAAMCQNNTGSNDPEFREVDLVVEYHTRVPTKVGKSTYR